MRSREAGDSFHAENFVPDEASRWKTEKERGKLGRSTGDVNEKTKKVVAWHREFCVVLRRSRAHCTQHGSWAKVNAETRTE